MSQLSASELAVLRRIAKGATHGESTAAAIQRTRFWVADKTRTSCEATADYSTGFKAGFSSKWQELQTERDAVVAARKLDREAALAAFRAGTVAALPAPQPEAVPQGVAVLTA